jgi:hypothetical protein
MRQTKFPPGWDEEWVRRVLAHYEEQTEEEDEAAFENKTVMEVPHACCLSSGNSSQSIKANSTSRGVVPLEDGIDVRCLLAASQSHAHVKPEEPCQTL